MNTKTITSILLILSLFFAQMSTVFALDAPLCPMMNSMSHEMNTSMSDHNSASDEQSVMDCCNDVVMSEPIDCCDSDCSCDHGMVSFASIINIYAITTLMPPQSLITSVNNKPLNIFISQVQRPPIYFIF